MRRWRVERFLRTGWLLLSSSSAQKRLCRPQLPSRPEAWRALKEKNSCVQGLREEAVAEALLREGHSGNKVTGSRKISQDRGCTFDLKILKQ